MKYRSTLISLLFIFLLIPTVGGHSGHSDDPKRTWSSDIQISDTFNFIVDVYEKSGEVVTDESGFQQGSEITVDILGNLSEIDLTSLEDVLLTDYSDYFQVTVDDQSSERFDTASAFLFVYPNTRDEGNGTFTNIFKESVEEDTTLLLYPFVTQTANVVENDDFTAELVNNNIRYTYSYDLETGLLNSYEKTNSEETIKITSSFSTDRPANIALVPIFTGIMVMVVLSSKSRMHSSHNY